MAVEDGVDESSLGSSFHSAYEAKEVIGKGMSSVVRRCVSRASGETLAVKVVELSAESVSEAEATRLKADAISEARHLRTVAGNPHIIHLMEFCQTPTSLYLVFELAPGGELFDYLSRQVKLSEKKTRNIMRQVFSALSCLHRHRIVHRDIKMENILMLNEETIKLTDFGFAYQLAEGEELKELVGTPGFLAPEVLRASMFEDAAGYGLPVDCWAAGVIAYTLLAGYAPFFHRRQLQMLRAIREGRYEFRSPDWDSVSAEAKQLIRQLLAVDVRQRLTAAAALEQPFFRAALEEATAQPRLSPRARFRAAIVQVRVLIRLLRLTRVPELVSAQLLLAQPYLHRKTRRTIDALAFRIYGHWVKKDREQYRDALFAHTLKRDRRKRPQPSSS